MKVLVLNVKKDSFTDKENNLVEYSKVTIGKQTEPSENFCGLFLEEINGKTENYDLIKNYVGKECEVTIEFVKNGKSYKPKLRKINNQDL